MEVPLSAGKPLRVMSNCIALWTMSTDPLPRIPTFFPSTVAVATKRISAEDWAALECAAASTTADGLADGAAGDGEDAEPVGDEQAATPSPVVTINAMSDLRCTVCVLSPVDRVVAEATTRGQVPNLEGVFLLISRIGRKHWVLEPLLREPRRSTFGVDAGILPPMTDAEVPLTGGTLNAVVRVGDTVRRSAGPWTPTIHALLRHVRDRGFDLAPEPFGFDDHGREVVSFIPGVTVGWTLPWPPLIRQEDLLIQVAEALARYHRAVVDFRPVGPVPWQSGPAVLAPSDLVCHHDLAPYNVVVRDGRLGGIIDWDLAGPGSALSDLAFVAWQWVPLHGPLVTRLLGWTREPNRIHRLRMLLDAYGLVDRTGFIDKVVDRIRFNRATMVRKAAEGSEAYQSLIDQGHLVGMDEAIAFLADEGQQLQGRL